MQVLRGKEDMVSLAVLIGLATMSHLTHIYSGHTFTPVRKNLLLTWYSASNMFLTYQPAPSALLLPMLSPIDLSDHRFRTEASL